MRLKTILTVICVLAIAGTSFGCVLFGTVKDENGKPIDAAKVKVYGKTCYGFSNSKGEFKIDSNELIDGGRYSVTVTAKGYDSGQTLATEVFEDPEEAEPLEVTMYKAEPEPEVTAASTNVPAMYGYGNIVTPNTNVVEDVEDYSADIIDTPELTDEEDKVLDYKTDFIDTLAEKAIEKEEDKTLDYKDDIIDTPAEKANDKATKG